MGPKSPVANDVDWSANKSVKLSEELWIVLRAHDELDLRYIDFPAEILVADKAFRDGKLKNVGGFGRALLTGEPVDRSPRKLSVGKLPGKGDRGVSRHVRAIG